RQPLLGPESGRGGERGQRPVARCQLGGDRLNSAIGRRAPDALAAEGCDRRASPGSRFLVFLVAPRCSSSRSGPSAALTIRRLKDSRSRPTASASSSKPWNLGFSSISRRSRLIVVISDRFRGVEGPENPQFAQKQRR